MSVQGPENAHSSGRIRYALGTLASLVMLLAMASWIWHRQIARPAIRLENLEITRLTDAGNVKTTAISQDGRYVAYVVNLGEKPVELPAGEIVLQSGPVEGRLLPQDTTVWLR